MTENDHWLGRLHAVVGRSFGRPHDPQAGPVWKSADGCWLTAVDGQRYLDFRSGYSATNFGHAPQRLIAVAETQMRGLSQLTQLPSTAMIELAEELLDFLDWHSGKVLFNVSGARGVETALKIALCRRPGVIVCFESGYHGRSLATQPFSDSATFSEAIAWPGMWKGQICRLPYPTDGTFASHSASWSEVLQQFGAAVRSFSEPLSAVLIEPMLGARGYLVPPDQFFQQLAHLTHELEGLIIADEVQVGLGRGGGRLMSASQQWRPDLVVLGKSLGGGLVPISAVVGEAQWIDILAPGCESETFAAQPLACAIARAGLRWLKELEPELPALGERLRERFGQAIIKYGLPAEIQGRGVVAVIDWKTKWPAVGGQSEPVDFAELRQAVALIAQRCLSSGLLLHPSGPIGNRLVLIPPLIVTEAEIEEAGRRFESALEGLLPK